jgi:hypothetical protein
MRQLITGVFDSLDRLCVFGVTIKVQKELLQDQRSFAQMRCDTIEKIKVLLILW